MSNLQEEPVSFKISIKPVKIQDDENSNIAFDNSLNQEKNNEYADLLNSSSDSEDTADENHIKRKYQDTYAK